MSDSFSRSGGFGVFRFLQIVLEGRTFVFDCLHLGEQSSLLSFPFLFEFGDLCDSTLKLSREVLSVLSDT